MSKGSGNRVTDREAYRRNWPLGSATGGNGTFVLRDGKLVPAQPEDAEGMRKRDSTDIISVAAGVQADQVPQATRDVAEAGLEGVSYTPDGRVKFRDRPAKLKYMKYAKMHDRDEVRG